MPVVNHLGEFETLLVEEVARATADTDFLSHIGGRALVEVQHEVDPHLRLRWDALRVIGCLTP